MMENTETLPVHNAPVGGPTAIKAAFTGRCPVCREGAVFSHPWYSLKFMENHRHCPVCNTDLEPEPGFMYGAMYVSYSINVATVVAVSLFIRVLFAPSSPWWYIGAVAGVTLGMLPFIFRLSRMMWVYVFGPWKYDPQVRRRGPVKV